MAKVLVLVNYPISKEDWFPWLSLLIGKSWLSIISNRDFTEVELQLIPYKSYILIYPKALLSTVPAVDKSILANNRHKIKAKVLYAFIPTAKDHWDFC